MKKNKKNKISNVILLVLFLIGFCVLLYPTFSNAWNEYRNSLVLDEYSDTIVNISDEKKEEILKIAKEYNDQHTTNTIIDAFDEEGDYVLSHPYDTLLNPTDNGVMGSVEIPKIDLIVPIYHGVGADVLSEGVGHVEGTSLPIGGKGTHSVIAGHRGLPTAKLFTDLDQIEVGDVFYLHILDDTLAYEVDQIKTVKPSQTEDLAIDPDEDYVTLLTCTPYGVNSHRLLIRGHRIEYDGSLDNEESFVKQFFTKEAFILMICGFIFVIILVLILRMLFKKEKKGEL